MSADATRVRLMLGEREVFNAPLQNLGSSKSGKSVRLAQDSSKVQSPVEAFGRIGWSLTVYGLPHTATPENAAGLKAEAAQEAGDE